MTAAPAGLWHRPAAPAGAAIPLGERTVAEGHTTARLRVVSKCALRDKKEEGPRFPGGHSAYKIGSLPLLQEIGFKVG